MVHYKQVYDWHQSWTKLRHWPVAVDNICTQIIFNSVSLTLIRLLSDFYLYIYIYIPWIGDMIRDVMMRLVT